MAGLHRNTEILLKFLDDATKIEYDKRKVKIHGKESVNLVSVNHKIMILRLKKTVRKQAKRLHKETEKLYKKLGDKKTSPEFDTNDVLLKMDNIENELKELREIINQEKEKAYLERMKTSLAQVAMKSSQ